MIFVVAIDQTDVRRARLADVLGTYADHEVLMYDDTMGKVNDLEQFAYPSLFNTTPSIVHSKFVLESDPDALTSTFIKILMASPTTFVFEEFVLPTPVLTSLKKAGAVVHTAPKEKAAKKEGDIFAVTRALTAPDKKSRWLIYRAALTEHPIEALIGIMYWKLKDMISKDVSSTTHRDLYTRLIEAHAHAWQSGTPLELAIEKVLLQ